jgi:uncharacterized protein (TIGR02001 family)
VRVVRHAAFISGALALAGFVRVAAAADLTGYAVLTTDYVWRGVTQSDGNPAVQLGGDVSFNSGIFAGIWGSTIDIDNGDGRLRDTEVNYYLGYRFDVARRWTLGVTAIAYTYPGQSGNIDYDYEELILSANFDDRLWFEYAWSPDLYHTGFESHNVEVFAEFPAGDHLVIGVGAGYYDVSEFVGDGYAYWEAGVTWPINRFALDLRYHDTSRWVPVISSPDRAGARVAFSVRVTF